MGIKNIQFTLVWIQFIYAKCDEKSKRLQCFRLWNSAHWHTAPMAMGSRTWILLPRKELGIRARLNSVVIEFLDTACQQRLHNSSLLIIKHLLVEVHRVSFHLSINRTWGKLSGKFDLKVILNGLNKDGTSGIVPASKFRSSQIFCRLDWIGIHSCHYSMLGPN